MRRLDDFHTTLANVFVALPRVHGALAAVGAAVGAFDRGIDLFPRRPGFPLMKAIDLGEYLFWRRFDAYRALNTERLGLHRDINENRGNKNGDDDGNGLEHGLPLGQLMLDLDGKVRLRGWRESRLVSGKSPFQAFIARMPWIRNVDGERWNAINP